MPFTQGRGGDFEGRWVNLTTPLSHSICVKLLFLDVLFFKSSTGLTFSYQKVLKLT